jgi:LuxR family maltose regulon positive regulatory protein
MGWISESWWELPTGTPACQQPPSSAFALIERLQQGMEGSLLLVSAPAGFGKTTLLAQWLALSGLRAAWLSLEPEDNDPVRFLSSVIAALQTLDPSLGRTALLLLQASASIPLETVLALLTHDLASSERGQVTLVLDDYQVVTAEPIHRALASLIEHRPPQLHLVLATRSDPPLPLARLRVRGQLTEVRATELRFTPSEARTFLLEVMGLSLAREDVTTLDDRTEGWIAGLQLAALSLQGRADVAEFLTAFTGSHRFVLDYLSEEVLAQQPTSVQLFLLQTCVLERLSGPLCNSLTKREDGQAILEAVDKANLFLVSLDDERRWYRYHHLFAQALRARLQQTAPTMIPELHRCVSTWYEQHGMMIEAVRYALAAPDFDLAARLIDQYGLAVGGQGQYYTLLGWLEALPDSLVRGHARLSLVYTMALWATNQLAAVEARLQDAERGLQADMPEEQTRVILGWVTVMRATLALSAGDVARCAMLARQALELVPETMTMLRSAGMLLMSYEYLAR